MGNKAEKKSIQVKLSRMTAGVALASATGMVLLVIAIVLTLRGSILSVSSGLGKGAAQDSRNALESVTIEQLQTLAYNKADLCNERLRTIAYLVEMLQDEAEEIVAEPENFKPNPVPFPNVANGGKLASQLLYGERVSFAGIREKAALMGNMDSILLSVIEHSDNATISYIGAEDGFIIICDDAADSKTGFLDPRERPWYIAAKENDRLIWTDVYADAYGRGLAITCAAPYYAPDGEMEGVVGVGALLNALTEIVVGTKVGENGYAFMLNADGEVIIGDDITQDESGAILRRDLAHETRDDWAALAGKMTSGERGFDKLVLDGEECYVAYAPLAVVPWSLATVMRVADAIAPAIESENRIISETELALRDIDKRSLHLAYIFVPVFLLSLVVIRILSRKFSRSMTEPILKLQRGVQAIATGDLDYRIALNTGDEIQDLGNSVNQMASALKDYIANLQTVTREKERIGAELNVAKKIQASMLPSIFPPYPNRAEFDVFASMRPAKEVGGDFYDFFLIGENLLAVVIADVSGKGVPAALFMVIAKTLIKNSAQSGMSPSEVFETVNGLLCENNEAGMFVTAFMGYLNLDTGAFTYVNAGHNPPLLRHAGGAFEMLRCKAGFVLAGMEGLRYRQASMQLSAGDRLYLYTDGVTEAANAAEELFGESRLLAAANAEGESDIKTFVHSLGERLDEFAGDAEQADDITMLVLDVKGVR